MGRPWASLWPPLDPLAAFGRLGLLKGSEKARAHFFVFSVNAVGSSCFCVRHVFLRVLGVDCG